MYYVGINSKSKYLNFAKDKIRKLNLNPQQFHAWLYMNIMKL